MEKFFAVLQIKILGNTLEGYLVSLTVFLGSVLFLKVGGRTLFARLKAFARKTTVQFDDFLVEVCEKSVFPLFYAGSFYLAVKPLTLPPAVDKLVHSLMVIVLTFQGIRLAVTSTVYLLEQTWLKKAVRKEGAFASKSILVLVRLVIWGLGFVFLLDNLGFNVSAIVTGLGISGIAVALAAQTILGDLFNYFVILFDKPFQEGDFIVSGDFMGEIETIGIKSTRIRALDGEELIVSNSNLTSSRIRNYRRISRRRVEFTLRVNHQTSVEQLKKIPQIIQQIIQGIKDTKFDRAHFKEFSPKEFGDPALTIEAVYYVLAGDFNKRMDVQQEINLALKEAFEKEGIRFA